VCQASTAEKLRIVHESLTGCVSVNNRLEQTRCWRSNYAGLRSSAHDGFGTAQEADLLCWRYRQVGNNGAAASASRTPFSELQRRGSFSRPVVAFFEASHAAA